MHSDARGAFNEAEMKQSLIESHFPVLPSWEHEVRPFEQLLERQDEGFHGIPGVSHPPQLLWVPSALNGAGMWGWDGDKRSKQEGGDFSQIRVCLCLKKIQSHLWWFGGIKVVALQREPQAWGPAHAAAPHLVVFSATSVFHSDLNNEERTFESMPSRL